LLTPPPPSMWFLGSHSSSSPQARLADSVSGRRSGLSVWSIICREILLSRERLASGEVISLRVRLGDSATGDPGSLKFNKSRTVPSTASVWVRVILTLSVSPPSVDMLGVNCVLSLQLSDIHWPRHHCKRGTNLPSG
jgi:hypothetical protein